jgi:hypothetical protein
MLVPPAHSEMIHLPDKTPTLSLRIEFKLDELWGGGIPRGNGVAQARR